MQELLDKADRAKAIKDLKVASAKPTESEPQPAPAEPTPEEQCGREIQAALLKYGMALRVVVTGTEIQVVRASK